MNKTMRGRPIKNTANVEIYYVFKKGHEQLKIIYGDNEMYIMPYFEIAKNIASGKRIIFAGCTQKDRVKICYSILKYIHKQNHVMYPKHWIAKTLCEFFAHKTNDKSFFEMDAIYRVLRSFKNPSIIFCKKDLIKYKRRKDACSGVILFINEIFSVNEIKL